MSQMYDEENAPAETKAMDRVDNHNPEEANSHSTGVAQIS